MTQFTDSQSLLSGLISCPVLRLMPLRQTPGLRVAGRQAYKVAKPRAEIQSAYRERRQAAGKVVVTIVTWTTVTPAEFAGLRKSSGNALRKLGDCAGTIGPA